MNMIKKLAIILLASGMGSSAFAAEDKAKPIADLTFFRPDKYTFTKCNWFEGWSFKEQFFPKYAPLAGSFHLYVKNPTETEFVVKDILFNGVSVKELREKMEIIWWKTTPNPIPAKGYSEVIVRTRHPLKTEDISITLIGESGESISWKVGAQRPTMNIAYVGFSRDIKTLYVYTESEKDTVPKSIFLDGKNITNQCKIMQQFKSVSFIEVDLEKPLESGAYHYLQVVGNDGSKTAHMLRAWDNWFDISLWGYPSSIPGFMKDHCFEERTPWVSEDFFGMTPDKIAEKVRANKDREFGAYYLMDEPDGHDYTFGAAMTDQIPLRLGYCAQKLSEAASIIQKEDPSRLTHLLINNTYKPANWNVYGELADIMSTDPYGTQDAISEITLYYVVEATQQALDACAPRPMFITLGSFVLKGKGFQRLPTPDEQRISLYYAIGCGAKGINYFIWGNDEMLTGISRSQELQQEIGRLNAEMQVCSPLLSISHPIKEKVITSSDDRLWTRALLAGNDNMVVVVVNNSYVYDDWRSKEGKYTLNAVKDAVLEIEIPTWLTFNEVCRVGFDGVQKLDFERLDSRRIKVKIEELKAGAMIVVTNDSSALIKRYNEKVKDVLRTESQPTQAAK